MLILVTSKRWEMKALICLPSNFAILPVDLVPEAVPSSSTVAKPKELIEMRNLMLDTIIRSVNNSIFESISLGTLVSERGNERNFGVLPRIVAKSGP